MPLVPREFVGCVENEPLRDLSLEVLIMIIGCIVEDSGIIGSRASSQGVDLLPARRCKNMAQPTATLEDRWKTGHQERLWKEVEAGGGLKA